MNASRSAADPALLLEAGNRAKRQGRFREALVALVEATRWAPRQAAAWLNRGVAHLELGQRDEAVGCFQRALALEPFRAEAHNILGHALLLQGRCGAAAAHLREALRLRPGYAAACDNLARVLKAQGRAADALALHQAALAAKPSAETHSNLLYTMNLVDLPAARVEAEHRRWADRYAPDGGKTVPFPPADPAARLRVGYVSADFCHHAVAYFFEPLLEHHDRRRCEIFCYSNLKVPDAVTARLESCVEPGHWRAVAGWSDDALERRIREDRLDVLIDLSGHTAGNRLGVFARRPAPVQATWLGYPNTTGLRAIDWRITDAIADPEDRGGTEELLRLSGPFSCYRPPAESPAPDPGPRDGPMVFGCFNHLAKIGDDVVALWSELLRAEAGSRLLLKARGLVDAGARADLRGRFARHGVPASQLELLGGEWDVRGHLEFYRRMDVALDPFPYNGATTTCEALWMGVPVVTLAGRSHAGRVGASMLTHAGFADGIAYDPQHYIAAARVLAAAGRKEASRAQRRAAMAASRLCDGAAFARSFEEGLFAMAGKNCRAPDDAKKDMLYSAVGV